MQNPILEIKSNPRLRIGLVIIVAIFWFYEILELRDRAAIASQSAVEQTRLIARLERQGAQKEWLQVARVAAERRSEAEKILWSKETIGSATAALQDWLQEKAKLSGIAKFQINLTDADDTGPIGLNSFSDKSDNIPVGIKKIRGRLNFDFDGASFDKFISAITAGEHRIFIENLLVRNINPARAEIQFFSLSRISGEKKSGS